MSTVEIHTREVSYMYNIGIVGSESSHAEAFAKLLNIPDPANGKYAFPGFRAAGIYGTDAARTKQVAADGMIPKIYEDHLDMIGKVDAVMVVLRRGSMHAQYSLPFINAGVPTWIDKPFTEKNSDALMILESAYKHNTLVMGGSTTKYVNDVIAIRTSVNDGSIGKIRGGSISFPATLSNDYGGIYFYGSHLVEMTLEIFGYYPGSVIASEKNGTVTAIVKYADYQVTMYFIPELNEYYSVLYGDKATAVRKIDINGCYCFGIEKFAEMINKKQLPSPLEDLCQAVAVMNAVKGSYETHVETAVEAIRI
jgi:predicted dehydrogenase